MSKTCNFAIKGIPVGRTNIFSAVTMLLGKKEHTLVLKMAYIN